MQPRMDMAVGTTPIRHTLTIARHDDVEMRDARVDRHLSQATALQVACAVALVRTAAVGSFGRHADDLDVIDDSEELNAVFAVPADIKIVRAIKYCDDTERNYGGCTLQNQQNMIVTAGASKETWAHEFGHSRGIDDRCTNDCGEWIMTSGRTGRKAIDADECSSFRRP
jgi:hypothetical protein